jgi:hypothetical protein
VVGPGDDRKGVFDGDAVGPDVFDLVVAEIDGEFAGVLKDDRVLDLQADVGRVIAEVLVFGS